MLIQKTGTMEAVMDVIVMLGGGARMERQEQDRCGPLVENTNTLNKTVVYAAKH